MAADFSHDCLYLTINDWSATDSRVSPIRQIIEYCFRPSSMQENIAVENHKSSVLTFDQLKAENVTAENLIEWSSPIDLVERYEKFLRMNESSSTERYYNCTVPWFGPFCQYRFVSNHSFPDIVHMQFDRKWEYEYDWNFTCYIHMKCNRGPSPICLDWREICDGKIDCLDGGEDEEHCMELEMNQCGENEYQCRNGMCVNEAFLSDDLDAVKNPECLDGSDEPKKLQLTRALWGTCTDEKLFRCEDLTCPLSQPFPCGYGGCSKPFLTQHSYSCYDQRDQIFTIKFNWNSAEDTRFPHCFKMLVCATVSDELTSFDQYCKRFCSNKGECKIRTLESCPSSFIAPTFPVWDDHVRLGYFANQTYKNYNEIVPQFVCYDKYRCPFLIPTFTVENYTCLHIHTLNLSDIRDFYSIFLSCKYLNESGNDTHCREPNMLRCLGTNKCIPQRQTMDGVPDCYGGFDESLAANSCALNDKYRFQCTSEKKCLSPMIVGDNKKQCVGGEDDPFFDGTITNIQQLPFSALCDNWIDLVSSTNETDETHCERWPCSNQYTRCNKVWNCLKGNDEVNCPSRFQCPADHHPCLLPKNHTMGCLHINQAEDGIVDCLGATDERSYCRSQYSANPYKRYRCWNDTTCVTTDDRCERCNKFDDIDQICRQSIDEISGITGYLESAGDMLFYIKLSFSHTSSPSFPVMQLQSVNDEHDQPEVIEIPQVMTDKPMDDRQVGLCNRGILILVGKNETEQCLCPPSYYGDRCQYQNQRVSLTIRLRKQNFTKLDVVGIVTTLVDHTGLVHSYEQITYIPQQDCDTKFNLYLLYRNRPKDMSKNYTINIDAYDRMNLIYLTSWALPVEFSFMPVNRVSAQLTIPAQYDCCLLCNHTYPQSLKNVGIDSYRCNLNRSSMISKIRYGCDCSPDSICVGFVNNRSICLCSLKKVGPRCLLNSICQMKTCANGGVCIPDDLRNSSTNFVCACSEGYSGKLCEKKDVRIDISFSDVEISQSLLLHFIKAPLKDDFVYTNNPVPHRETMLKKIPFHYNTITFYMAKPFHLVFAQIADIYYLIVLQHNYTSSAAFSTQIAPSRRCPHIRELFDEPTVSFPVLRRVKYYHDLCKNNSNLLCFHDHEIFMCLCTEERHANCFHFDFNMTYNCHGQNECQNGAECFQDHPKCPSVTMCVCPECFYGAQCQFSTKHPGLSLDAILGYHIYPQLSIGQQSVSVKISIAVATLMLAIVLISGTLSALTFRVKACREVGCGLYLYTSSIISIITIIVLNLKLWSLILSQMNIITSEPFLLFNCITIEFLLRSLLAIIDWLHACVAIERVFVACLGVKFNKKKSKRAARRLIIVIILFVAVSIVHDPIYRRLFDDIEEKRTWCLVRFTPSVNSYNTYINLFHFIIPFSLNLISAIVIIVFTAKQRFTARAEHSFRRQLKEQFHRHKHLILSSIFLVILSLPRLIISLLPNCMKSPRQYQLFLAGYFISFIPLLLIFFIFILTSKMYKKECNTMIRQKWKAFRHRLNRS